MLKKMLTVAVVLFLSASVSLADTLSGTIHHKDGSKVNKTAKISTSWNGELGTYPASGQYKIDFKGKVGQKITIYVNGDTYAVVEVKGDTKLNIRLTK